MILVTHKWILVAKQRILCLQSMILEKLSIKVNPKKYIDPPGKRKKKQDYLTKFGAWLCGK